MGSFVRLKIVRRVYDQSPSGYSNTFKLYLAEEISPAPFNAYANNVYLLSSEDYKTGSYVNLDENQQEEFKNNKNGMFNGNRIFVEKARPLVLAGHFKVRQSIGATTPIEHFRNTSIDRSQYVLYEADHIVPGAKAGELTRVFSAVRPGYWRGESIPASEVTQIFPLGLSDTNKYYLHDHSMYLKRLMEARPKC